MFLVLLLIQTLPDRNKRRTIEQALAQDFMLRYRLAILNSHSESHCDIAEHHIEPLIWLVSVENISKIILLVSIL